MFKRRLCALLVAAQFGVAAFARAEAYSITANPGEDCSTQMNIGWQADFDDINDVVVYTTKADTSWAHAATAQGKFKKCEIFDGINSKTPAGADWREEAKFLDYGVTLDGLTPDTAYMYKIG